MSENNVFHQKHFFIKKKHNNKQKNSITKIKKSLLIKNTISTIKPVFTLFKKKDSCHRKKKCSPTKLCLEKNSSTKETFSFKKINKENKYS